MVRLKTLCIFLIILGSGCDRGSHPKISKGLSNDSIHTSGTSNQKKTPVLAELKSEEIHLTDDDFGNTISLTGTQLNIKEIIRPDQLLVKDKYLITNNIRQDSIFMIFQLPELKCVSAFGVKGRGPDEFSIPRIIETSEDSILFYIYELSNNKLYKIDIKNLYPRFYLTLPKHNKSFDDKQIVFIDDKNAFYSSSTDKGKMIYTYNKDSLPQEKEFKDLAIPGIKGSWTTFTGDFGMNKSYGRIAYAYKYFKRLRIIDINSLADRHIIFDAEELAEGQNDIATLEPTNVTHFWGMSPNSDYFWMLYSGRTPVDVLRDNRSNNKYIFVEKYDWNGNPVKRYRLDDWGYFCLDDNNQTIYLASTASAFPMVRYSIPDN